jgi:hypothetical protein
MLWFIFIRTLRRPELRFMLPMMSQGLAAAIELKSGSRIGRVPNCFQFWLRITADPLQPAGAALSPMPGASPRFAAVWVGGEVQSAGADQFVLLLAPVTAHNACMGMSICAQDEVGAPN